MNENIKKFLVKLEKSPELQAQLSQLRDPEEAYKLAASIQDGFTKEEFVSEMKKIHDAQSEGLSEEDLDKVAGGLDDQDISMLTGISAMTVVGSAAASAAV